MKANIPERIYVSNYSSGLAYNWHNERLAVNDIEYVRTDTFIKETALWLLTNASDYVVLHNSYDTEELVKDYIDAMKRD